MNQTELGAMMEEKFHTLRCGVLHRRINPWSSVNHCMRNLARELDDPENLDCIYPMWIVQGLIAMRWKIDGMTGTSDAMRDFADRLFVDEIQALRKAGQQEYAGAGQDAFANFDRVASALNVDRKKVLMVYAWKHLDGIRSYIEDGHTSQREDVRGRINDLIVYMFLLMGMIEEWLVSKFPERGPSAHEINQNWYESITKGGKLADWEEHQRRLSATGLGVRLDAAAEKEGIHG